ncbi:MAG: hypothetical protein QGG53_45285 [Planctomycetota bacterium]|jgi:hypothetical protein|nr:hypothetical protein [Planctomycetota bacterium]
MSALNKSIVEEAALTWLGDLNYAASMPETYAGDEHGVVRIAS